MLLPFFAQGQSCDILMEDFESFDCQSSFLSQANGSWIKFFDGASNPGLQCSSSGVYLNVNSNFYQGTGTGESELVQVLNLSAPQVIDYQFEFLNECGILSLDFLDDFVDSGNFNSIKRVTFTYNNDV